MFQFIESTYRTLPIHHHGVADLIKDPEYQYMSTVLIWQNDLVSIDGFVGFPTPRRILDLVLNPFAGPEGRKYVA